MNVGRSYAYCERLARRTAANFYPAFLVLPRHQRRAMFALYAFNRLTDDISDDGNTPNSQSQRLDDWQQTLTEVLAGHRDHTYLTALRDAATRFAIPRQHFHEVIEGCRLDLTPRVYASFAELTQYCRLVASSVGQACIHIWGFHGQRAKALADAAGIALQLTNILRDIDEDRKRGRVYLPAEELKYFGCSLDSVGCHSDTTSFRSLMQFQVERAKKYYKEAAPLHDCLDASGRAVFSVIFGTYRRLLDRIEQSAVDVLTRRVRVPRLEKIGLVLRALPVRWGWTRV